MSLIEPTKAASQPGDESEKLVGQFGCLAQIGVAAIAIVAIASVLGAMWLIGLATLGS